MTNNGGTRTQRVNRRSSLQWVPISLMRTAPVNVAQREFRQARGDELVADFNLDAFGTISLSLRDGVYWIIDGQHRIYACREIGWGDQKLQCWVFEGLTEAEEAELFLSLNHQLNVTAMTKFNVSVTAKREAETEVHRVVEGLGLHVSSSSNDGNIGAVGTLLKVYHRSGSTGLERTLRIIRDAYGSAGFESSVIDGLGMVVQRYGSEVDDTRLVERLSSAIGGVSGLVNKAEVLRRQTGSRKSYAVAAAAVELYNRGRGGRKIPDWFHLVE